MSKNKETFTTGDIAKLCNVSVRTVQYYHKEGIVSPTELSEGGRRIYTKEDAEKFKWVCLYKSLGFSLEKIKSVVNSNNKYEILKEEILNEENKIDEQISMLIKTRHKLKSLREDIEECGCINVENIDELERLLRQKKKHRKTDIMTYIFLICYIAILCIGLGLTATIGGFYPYAMLIIGIILLLALIYYHSSVNAYRCPGCHEKFEISFIKDMFSLNGGKKGKLLKCPYCKKRAWMKETFKEESSEKF